jgi:DegV family protein with EDD domain
MLIVTDGAVDVPETFTGSALLRRVPGEVWDGEAPFRGGVEEFWAQLRKGVYPSTTPPTVSDLARAYQHPDLVIALHISRQLSATVQHAEEAAARAGPDVVVIDTRSFSVGSGLIVAAVCKAAEGSTASEPIIEFAKSLPERLHTFAIVQEVESLRRSNRSGLIPTSHLVRNHPLILAVRGRVVTLAQPKHRSGAISEIAKHLLRSVGHEPGAWALGHGDATDVDAVIDGLTRALGRRPNFFTPLDPIVGAHLGPEAIVVGAISAPIEV